MKQRIAVIVAVFVASYALGARAGARAPGYVATVGLLSSGDGSDNGYGTMEAARDSADVTNGVIWCAVDGTASTVTATCDACDTTTPGKCVQCSSSDPNIIAIVQSVNTTSHAAFTNAPGGNNICAQIAIFNGSGWNPKK
jgi:hypothetical protein